LTEALRTASSELAGSTNFSFVVEGTPRELHPILRDEIYRIAFERLRNAFKHARVQRVEGEVTYGERLFRLRIRDDGDSIPSDILESGRPGHFGLKGMREAHDRTASSWRSGAIPEGERRST
jgi:signal transduction histidine kinase